MALTNQRAQDIAAAVVDVASQIESLRATMDVLLRVNNSASINWGTPPGEITLDGNGNMQGKHYTPANISNAIGVIAGIRDEMAADGGTLALIARTLG